MHAASGWTRGESLYSLLVRQTFGLQGAVIALGLALPPLAVVPLHLQERLIDRAVPDADVDLIVVISIAYAGAMILTGAIKFSVTYMRGWIAEIVSRILRGALIDAQRRRQPGRAQASLGTVTSVLTAEVEPLGGFSAEAINTPLIQGGTLVGVIGFMVYTEPVLAAIGAGALIAEAVVTPIIQHRINLLTRDRIRSLRRAGRDMVAAADPLHHEQIGDGLHEIRLTYRLRLRMNLLKAALKVINNLIGHVADIAILGVGGWMVVRGETEIGVIVAFMSGLSQVRGPWHELIGFYRRFADARIKYRLVVGALNGGEVPVLAAQGIRP